MDKSDDTTTAMPMMRCPSSTVSKSSDVAHGCHENSEMTDQSVHQEDARTVSNTELEEGNEDKAYYVQASSPTYRSRRSSGQDRDPLKMIKLRRDSGLKSMFQSNSTKGGQRDNGGGGELHLKPTMSGRSISAPASHAFKIDNADDEIVDSRHRTNSQDSALDFEEEIYHLENSLRMSQILADRKVTFYTEALLHDAIQRDDLDELCDLLNKHNDLDLEKPNSFGITLLHRAAIDGSYRCLNLLLSRNVNVKVRDMYGWTPLHDAVYHGHIRCAAALITAGSNVEAETNDFTKPIEMADDDEMLLLVGRAMTSPGYVYDPDRETLV